MTSKPRKAPDVTMTLSDGKQKRLSDFWRKRKLVLVFVRHFG